MKSEIVITPEMQQAIDIIQYSTDHLYLTGKAGTGKTTLLRHILRTVKKNFVIAASTGVAAINAGGCTLHSLLSIPFGVLAPDDVIKKNVSPNKIKMLQMVDTIIIDEISMVRPDVLDYIDRKLRLILSNEQPFGGIQIVMIGDLFQLPPVVKKEELVVLQHYYRGSYFFHAEVWRKTEFKIVELNQVFRQSDSKFVNILNRTREYQLTDDDIEELECCRSIKSADDFENKAVHLCARKSTVQEINNKLLGEATHTFTATLTNDFNPMSAPCDLELSLRLGARVMMTVNDPQKKYYNGSLGVVVGLSDDGMDVRLDSGLLAFVTRHTWTDIEYVECEGKIVKKEKGSCTQYPVTLAWAITIHKSQGLTFDNIVIHTKGMFAPGQMYVALSRCTSLSGISTDAFISPKHIFADRELLMFVDAYRNANYVFNRDVYRMMRNGNQARINN
jgi:hypothetical protein